MIDEIAEVRRLDVAEILERFVVEGRPSLSEALLAAEQPSPAAAAASNGQRDVRPSGSQAMSSWSSSLPPTPLAAAFFIDARRFSWR